jgi:hypothetical protein
LTSGGIEVGAVTTPAALLSAMGLNNCKPTGICNDYAQFPHVVEYSSMTTVQLDNWRVMRIAVAFGAFRFEAIDKALREKLGEPNVLLHPSSRTATARSSRTRRRSGWTQPAT